MQTTADPRTRRTLAGGDIIGSLEADGTLAWRGIPYAAPPVDALRWRAPQAVPPWPGVREALTHGPMAPQIGGLLAGLPPQRHGHIVGDEDCLTLNVFAPAEAADPAAPRPVMVWIHGGALAVGTSATYDVARNLARRDGVVVVTINYRLGVLGWFAHPALAEGATPEERSGNFGLLDQIAALRWVRENIAAFGGDPGCVTIFGESAGGQSVLLLLASPLAAGLFQRAIAQSPVAETFSMDEAVHGRADAVLDSRRCGALEVASRVRAAAIGRGETRPADEAAFLRGCTPARLIEAFKPGSVGIYLSPRPVRDGVVLPLAPLTDVFAAGAWNRVPVLLGSNRDEMRTFLADKPQHVRLLGGKLPLLRDRAAYAAESRTMSDAWRAMHVDAPADAMLAGGHPDVWTYRFDWDEAPAVPFVRPDLLLGASHAMEMPFVFRDTAGEFDLFKVFTPFNRRGREAVAQAMGDGWTSFARAGVPSLPGGVAWARRQAGPGPDSLLIDTPRGGGLRMDALRRSMAELKQALFTAPWPAEWRCRIYARMLLWAPLFEGHGSPAEYHQWCTGLGWAGSAEAFRPAVEV